MRKSRIELLTSKFDNLRMEENETIRQYHDRISDISNESFILREKISKKILYKKFYELFQKGSLTRSRPLGKKKTLRP